MKTNLPKEKTMKTTLVCDQCGAALPADSPRGLCPQCLMNVGMESTLAGDCGAEGSDGHSEILNPPREDPATGALLPYFGDYELLEKISQGGMGIVYKARQVKLNRIVAVKMILGGQLASETDIQRFLTEAEAAANLQHPNIVSIHEVGEHEGRHYFSMDYVEGKNVADFIKDNSLSAARAARLIKTIAEAIHFAHQRGTLHRDLKPQNVLIDAEGQPRITDFGLAKLTRTDSSLTREGVVMGSPSYMPPEQAAGKNDLVGPASDVYSIGAMLYHLLTGRAPFMAETPLATLRKVMEEEPTAPSKLNPKMPSDLETICLKCLEKQPLRRYHSARELAEEIDRFLNHEPILARPAGAGRKTWAWLRQHPWSLTGLAAMWVMTLMALAYGLWKRTVFLEWRAAHPGEPKPHPYTFFDSSSILYAVIAFSVFGFFLWGNFLERKRRGFRFPPRYLFTNAIFGCFQITLACLLVFKGIDAKVWSNPVWYRNDGVFLAAFTLFWFGILLIWQCVQQHQTAVYGVEHSDEGLGIHQVEMDEKAFRWTFLAEAVVCCCLAFLVDPSLQRTFWVFLLTGFAVAFFSGCCWFCWGVGRQFWAFAVVAVLVFSAFVFYKWHDPQTKIASWFFGLFCGFMLVKLSRMRRTELTDAQRRTMAPPNASPGESR